MDMRWMRFLVVLLALPLLACGPDDAGCRAEDHVFVGSQSLELDEEALEELACVRIITGSLTIDGASSLKPLRHLVQVQGDLTLRNVNALDGLENLQEVGGTLRLESRELRSVQPLRALTKIGKHFQLWQLRALESLEGLEQLERIGGDFEVLSNEALVSLEPLQALRGVEGDLVLSGNDSLVSAQFGGPAFGPSVRGRTRINSNHALRHVVRLEAGYGSSACEGADFDVDILNNRQLEEVSFGYQMGGCIRLASSPALKRVTFEGVSKLEHIELSMLPNLTELAGSVARVRALEISGTGLADLGALSFAAIDCDLRLTDNPVLAQLETSVATQAASRLHIHGNPALPTCEVERLVASLGEPQVLCEDTFRRTIPLKRWVVIAENGDSSTCP